jgi:hypothetical protein
VDKKKTKVLVILGRESEAFVYCDNLFKNENQRGTYRDDIADYEFDT